MREIERTTRFRRDYKRETRGRHSATLEASLLAVLHALVSDEVLAERTRRRRRKPKSGWRGNGSATRTVERKARLSG